TAPAFVDTVTFIVTGNGTVYRSTEKSLREYAPGLLERVPLDKLVTDSDLWLRLPMDLSLWILPVGLWQGGPWLGATSMISVYVVSAVLSPAGVSLYAMPLVRFLDRVTLQALYFIVSLSVLAQNGRLPEMWTGVGGFVVLRWSLMSRALGPILDRATGRIFRMPVPDQVLRAVIIKYAIRFGVSIPSLSDIEEDVKSITRR
ncbi:MAG: hypothetical protein R3178_04250, partial [Rhodothermales bacterium]|nr:hypothetical protein [Rhodothermales bacterium]